MAQERLLSMSILVFENEEAMSIKGRLINTPTRINSCRYKILSDFEHSPFSHFLLFELMAFLPLLILQVILLQ